MELRLYDQAVVAAFLSTFEGRANPVVFANAQRPFATLQKMFSDSGKILELPVIAVSRIDYTIQDNRARFLTDLPINTDPEHENKIYKGTYPIAVDIMYNLDIWSETRRAMNWLQKFVLTRFKAKVLYLTINLGIWGNKLMSLNLDTLRLNDPLEPNEDRSRPLRSTFSFVFHGWIFYESVENTFVSPDPGNVFSSGDTVCEKVITAIYKENPDGSQGVFWDEFEVSST